VSFRREKGKEAAVEKGGARGLEWKIAVPKEEVLVLFRF